MSARPDLTGEPIAVQMQYPGDYWDQDWETERTRERNTILDDLDGASVVGLVDTDADGRGCEVVLRERFDSDVAVIPAGHRATLSVVEALDLVADTIGTNVDIIMADLCPNERVLSELVTALGRFSSATVCDHHEWSATAQATLRDVGTLVLADDRCATQIVLEEFHPTGAEWLSEFAAVTADHDLGINEDARSADLSDYSFWASRAEYVAAARTHGANISEDPDVQSVLAAERREKRERIQLAAENATWEHISGFEVAIAYGEAHATKVGETLVDEGADIAVLVPPYNKISVRTAPETPIAHLIAREFGGGGHEHAAGAKPNLVGYRGDVTYETHWETNGAHTIRHVCQAIQHAVSRQP